MRGMTRYGVRVSMERYLFDFDDYQYDEYTCSDCADDLEDGNVFEFGRKMLCPSCFKEAHRIPLGECEPCADCGEYDEDDQRFEDDGDVVCSACLLGRYTF